ncbi:hypothetical protein [Microcystis phage Mae-JY04]|uniref:hypothetical protein n=1 Tax=Blastomonas sp. TaxID=1909299 RepID=UPI00258931DF|nr:hypothetical protein [Blastomonas sp.]
MTTRIGGIVVDIDARLAKLEKELAKGNRELSKFEKNATASGSRIEKGLIGISRGFGALAGGLAGLGIAVGIGAVQDLGMSVLTLAADLDDAANQTGTTVERFQSLKQAFEVLAIDGDMFDKSMLRLVGTLGDVQSGVEDGATKALDKMGITARILSGEIDTTDQLLDAIAASSTKFGTEAEFASAVIDIFGRRVGPQMAAALKDGGAALKAAEQDVRDFGTVLSQEQITKLADAEESIRRFQEVATYRLAIIAADAIDYFGEAGAAAQRFIGIMATRGLADAMGDLVFGDKVKANPNDASDVSSRLGFSAGRIKFDAPRIPVVRTGGGGGGGGMPRRSGGGGGGSAREADTFARSMAELTRRTADARMEFTALNEQWDDVTITDAKMRAEALRTEQEQGTKWTELQRSQYRAAAEDLRSLAIQTKIAEINQKSFNDSLADTDLSGFTNIPKLEADLEKIVGKLPDLRSKWEVALGGLDDAQGVAFDGLTRNLEGAMLGFQSLEDAAEGFGKQLLSMALQAFVFAPLGKALKIPGYAGGTDNHPGGLAVVGENGPELLNLPRGSQVIPNDRLMNMGSPRVASVGMAGGAPVINQSINFSGGVDLATRAEVFRLADATKRATLAAMSDSRRRSPR